MLPIEVVKKAILLLYRVLVRLFRSGVPIQCHECGDLDERWANKDPLSPAMAEETILAAAEESSAPKFTPSPGEPTSNLPKVNQEELDRFLSSCQLKYPAYSFPKPIVFTEDSDIEPVLQPFLGGHQSHLPAPFAQVRSLLFIHS